MGRREIIEELDSDDAAMTHSPRKALASIPETAHDWDAEKKAAKKIKKGVYDDGTMTFFW